MALFCAQDELRSRGLWATFLGSYAWRQEVTRGGGAVEEPGLAGCRYDSLGLFALKPVSTFSRLLTVPTLRGEGAKNLQAFDIMQGYKATAYQGGEQKILAAYGDTVGYTHGDGDSLPHIKQKALQTQIWDATGRLRGHGAHMPLLFYVGEKSGRSEQALTTREQNMVHRGWGPSSVNRAWQMTKGAEKGKGKGKGKGKSKS